MGIEESHRSDLRYDSANVIATNDKILPMGLGNISGRSSAG
jgi:hypothetical protein